MQIVLFDKIIINDICFHRSFPHFPFSRSHQTRHHIIGLSRSDTTCSNPIVAITSIEIWTHNITFHGLHWICLRSVIHNWRVIFQHRKDNEYCGYDGAILSITIMMFQLSLDFDHMLDNSSQSTWIIIFIQIFVFF